jgi:AraC-like DNA-binding protein
MKKRNVTTSTDKDLPVFDLNAFSKKARWSDFYIQELRDHINEHAFVGKPHKHDFYLILFVEEGEGVHIIDFVQYRIKPKSIFLMTPGQVHTWAFSEDSKGFVIFFTRAFYEMHLSRNSLLEFPFYNSLVATPVVYPSTEEPFKFAIRQMFKEYVNTDTPDLRILRAYLDIFLLEAAKSHDSSHNAPAHNNTFKLRKLEHLIEENFRTLRRPGDYGELMNLAPSYLNSICKDSLGKTLTELIQSRLLLEAKRMYAYSDMNVNEVAAKLNFTDPSYFVRWFKKQNGSTAEDFRKSI